MATIRAGGHLQGIQGPAVLDRTLSGSVSEIRVKYMEKGEDFISITTFEFEIPPCAVSDSVDRFVDVGWSK